MGKSLVFVEVQRGDIARALKLFKRKVLQSGHILETRDRKYYTKPTTAKREMMQAAERKESRKTILDKIAEGKLPPNALGTKKKKIIKRSSSKEE